MESVKRYTAQIIGEAHAWKMVMGSDFSKVDAERRRLEVLLGDRSVHIVALNEDLDRVTAEREALQLLLNNRDDLDDQLTTLEQRRYAEQQAREAAERRVDELESERATLRDALLIYSGQHERSDKVGHIEMLDIAQAALNGSSRKPEQSGRPIVAWALTFNGEFNSGWISAGASKASAEGMRDNYISVCRPCNLPKLALVPLTAALNPTAEAESNE